jgi:hypothetical protein
MFIPSIMATDLASFAGAVPNNRIRHQVFDLRIHSCLRPYHKRQSWK